MLLKHWFGNSFLGALCVPGTCWPVSIQLVEPLELSVVTTASEPKSHDNSVATSHVMSQGGKAQRHFWVQKRRAHILVIGGNQWGLFQGLHLTLRLEGWVGVTKQKPLSALVSSSIIWGNRTKFSSSSEVNYSLSLERGDLNLPGKQMWPLFRKLLVFTFMRIVYYIVEEEKIFKAGIWVPIFFQYAQIKSFSLDWALIGFLWYLLIKI